MLHHFELQLSHRRENRIALAFIGVVKDLNGTFFAKFIHPLAEILERRRVWIAQPAEDFRAEAGNPLVLNPLTHVEGVADREHAGVVEANHISGIGVLHHGSILTEEFLRS